MTRYSVALSSALLAALLSGCAAPGDYRPELVTAEPLSRYPLAAGDRLRVIVYGQDALSNSYAVDGSGRISMPLIGAIPVRGRDPAAVEREITDRLHAGFIRDPRVSVEVEAFRPFFVLGEVNTAGQFPYVEGMSARTAVAIAGGFNPRGYQGGVDLTRVINGEPVTGRVPLDTPILPGDTVMVRERIF